jgi:hypothetical protein
MLNFVKILFNFERETSARIGVNTTTILLPFYAIFAINAKRALWKEEEYMMVAALYILYERNV